MADSTPYGRRWWAGAGEKWRRCAKNMHDPNGLLDTRSESPRGPAQTTEPPGQKPLVVNGVVVSPFEEEEEGTGVARDVVKVEGEDPATPGPLP